MDRSNHYELAFESYLQAQRLCYVAVDETRRALLGDVPVKSLDFLVFGRDGAKLVVDVQGPALPRRHAATGRAASGSAGRSRDDVDGLERWATLVGADYRGAARLRLPAAPDGRAARRPRPTCHVCRGRRYLFRAVEVERLPRAHARAQPALGTVDAAAGASSAPLVRPLRRLHPHAGAAEECPF